MIANLFRKLFKVKKCKDLSELCAYVPIGDLFFLARWIEWRTPYKADKTLKDEWESADVAIKRGSCDCEEKAIIASQVIKTWKGWMADVMVVQNSRPGKAHAVCIWWGGGEWGIIDDGILLRYTPAYDMRQVVMNRWPTATKYYFTDKKGKLTSAVVLL